MKNKDKKVQERKETPIVDGDARPDNQLGPDDQTRKKGVIIPKDKDIVSKERAADTNSLEDYKDAKPG
jgi:hypothetical protein